MSVSAAQMQEWCAELIAKSPNFPSLEECLAKIPTLDSLTDLPAGTKILVRGDTDVVFDDDGQPDDDSRLRSLIDTLKFGVERGWIQIVYGHRGRDPKLSLEPVAQYLKNLLAGAGLECGQLLVIGDWMNDATGEILDSAGAAVAKLGAGSIVMLENTRQYKLEQALWKAKPADLAGLAPKLANYANGLCEKIARVHVNEAFAASNRDLSSTVVPAATDRNALGKYIDGELRTHLQKTRLAELVIFSGMKLEKLDDLQAILNRGKVRVVIAAGLLALALKKADADLAGKPFEMGVAGSQKESKIYIPAERIEQARSMLTGAKENAIEFVLPVDFILGDGKPSETIPPDGAQFDVGPKTIALYVKKVDEFIQHHQKKMAAGKGPAVAFHNGVFGKFEEDQFSIATRKFMHQLKRMTEAGVLVYVGGGEGGAALHKYGDESWVTHCFTAGGTILKALGTEPIPYLKALYMAASKKSR
ncbi:MAG TPA: phosphoglycerate kinase [Planctomycetaceae bacterium]|nr:phosphoglycerate kinase [Planctomycetaceae bacterium]